jgi:hypothetical protein
MKTSLIIGSVFLILGGVISYFVFRSDKVKYVDASIDITGIRKIKHLHLVDHFYEDVIFLHKNDDTLKPIQAIITVPVQVTGYVDLEKCEIDTIKKELRVPLPELTEPKYDTPHARHVRRVFFGKPADYITRYANLLKVRKSMIIAKAKANNIVENTKSECEAYFQRLFQSLGIKYGIIFHEK